MIKNYISIDEGGEKKQILLISYTKDGGFYIKDLIRINQEEKKCSILKIKTDTNFNGTRTTNPIYKAVTKGEVKLMHHFDGRAQISGTGVISGYQENGDPKGASINSFELTQTNDGGPAFSFMLWGKYSSFRNGKKDDIILKPEIRKKFEDTNGPYTGLVIEGFYIPKNSIKWINNEKTDYINFISPVEGKDIIRLIPSPVGHPGLLGLTCGYIRHGFESEIGFTLGGGPGIIYDEHFCDCLHLIYPHNTSSGNNGNGYINLDYSSTHEKSS